MPAFIREENLIVRSSESNQLLISPTYIISDTRIEMEKELFKERTV